MKKTSSQPTTEIKQRRNLSFFSVLLASILIFLILFGAMEGICRTGKVDSLFPLRSVGNYHTQFEIKWFKLDKYVKQNGGVDVILLGNSMVNTGIDPELLSAKYKDLTGEDLRIFNFGVEGLTVEPLSVLAQILVDRYHPKTIILYTEMRDYIAGNGDQITSDFLENAWIQQQLGNASIEGYLESNSQFLQRILPFRYWGNSDFLDTYILNVRRIAETTDHGYEPGRHTGAEVTRKPDPTDPADILTFQLFENYTLSPARVEALEQILNLKSSGTEVFLAEMPVYATYFMYLQNESDRSDYLANIENIAQENNGVFLPPITEKIVDSAFSDNHHLNIKGAEIYTNLLAQQLADLCLDQQICLESSLHGESQP